jgi:hypothetical protein
LGHFKQLVQLVASFNLEYSLDFTRLLFLHRFVTAFIGTLTVPIIFLIARNLFNSKAGLLCSLLFALTPLHVYTSMDAIGPDNLQLFFICLSFLYACKIFLFGKKKYYLLAGLFAGLAASSKYFGIFCIGPLLLAHFYNSEDKRTKGYIYIGLAAILGVLAITCLPLIIDFKDSIATFRFFINNYGQPVSDHNTVYQALARARGWLSYPNSLFYGLGPGIFVLSILGLFFRLIKRNRKGMLILIFPVTYYLFIGYFYDSLIEYILPIVPFMIFLACDFVIQAFKLCPAVKKRLIIYPLFFVTILPSLNEVIYYKNWISQDSAEGQAQSWILRNIPPDSSVLMDADDLSGSRQLEPLLFCNQKLPYRISFIDWRLGLKAQTFFNNNEFDYVIIDVTRALPKGLKPFYSYIENEFTLIREFSPIYPTPRRDFFSIYGTIYNHSYKVFKKRDL